MSKPFHCVNALLPLCAALALMGCAAPALTPQARSHYDASHQRVSAAGAALVVDSCLYRLEVGTSHVYPELSERHARTISQALVPALQAKGVRVMAQQVPFVCSTMEPDHLLSIKQRAHPDAELQAIAAYPLKPSDEALAAGEEAQLLALMKAVRALPATVDRAPDTATQAVPLALTAEQAQALSKKWGTPFVWLVDVRQQDVSAGRAIGIGIMTGVLTAGLSGGAFATISTSEDAELAMTALVDLDKRELLWKKQTQAVARGLIDFEREPVTVQQLQNWANNAIFVPFYDVASDKETGKPNSVAALEAK